jgi:HrpA-like RNA helicase
MPACTTQKARVRREMRVHFNMFRVCLKHAPRKYPRPHVDAGVGNEAADPRLQPPSVPPPPQLTAVAPDEYEPVPHGLRSGVLAHVNGAKKFGFVRSSESESFFFVFTALATSIPRPPPDGLPVLFRVAPNPVDPSKPDVAVDVIHRPKRGVNIEVASVSERLQGRVVVRRVAVADMAPTGGLSSYIQQLATGAAPPALIRCPYFKHRASRGLFRRAAKIEQDIEADAEAAAGPQDSACARVDTGERVHDGCRFGRRCRQAHVMLPPIRRDQRWLCDDEGCATVNSGGVACQVCSAARPNSDENTQCVPCQLDRPFHVLACPECGTTDSPFVLPGDEQVASETPGTSSTPDSESEEGSSNTSSSSSETDDGAVCEAEQPPSLAPPAAAAHDGHGGRTTRRKLGAWAALPILAAKDDVLNALKAHRVLICKAETGSGKTTQLPQYFADDPHFADGGVFCTQPRQLAAMSLAQRVAQEYDGLCDPDNSPRSQARDVVTFLTGPTVTRSANRLNFLTEDGLIRRAKYDPLLSDCRVLIIDEAHERNLNTDIVLGIAKNLLRARPHDFSVVVASATIDETKFLEHFQVGPECVLSVPGRTFPVAVEKAVNHESLSGTKNGPDPTRLVEMLLNVLPQHEKHTLCFLPTQRSIEQCVGVFMAHPRRDPAWVALPVYGSLPPEEQQAAIAFDADPSNAHRRMIAFCTNVAETSLTIAGVKLVVYTGLENRATYDPVRRMNVLALQHISQSSANQRKGRAGRISPGHCIRAFDYDQCEPNSVPEILRASLDSVVLRVASVGFRPLDFPFIESPNPVTLQASIALLEGLGCLRPGSHELNPKGKAFFDQPFDPRWSEFICRATEAEGPGVLRDAISAAAVFCAPPLFFFGGADADEKLQQKHLIRKLGDGFSGDVSFHVAVLRRYCESGSGGACTHNSSGSKSTAKSSSEFHCEACRRHFVRSSCLNGKVAKMVAQTVRQCLRTWRLLPGSSTRATRTKAEPAEETQPCLQASMGEPSLSDVEHRMRNPAWIGVALAAAFPESVYLVPISGATVDSAMHLATGDCAKIQEMSTVTGARRLPSATVRVVAIVDPSSGAPTETEIDLPCAFFVSLKGVKLEKLNIADALEPISSKEFLPSHATPADLSRRLVAMRVMVPTRYCTVAEKFARRAGTNTLVVTLGSAADGESVALLLLGCSCASTDRSQVLAQLTVCASSVASAVERVIKKDNYRAQLVKDLRSLRPGVQADPKDEEKSTDRLKLELQVLRGRQRVVKQHDAIAALKERVQTTHDRIDEVLRETRSLERRYVKGANPFSIL